MTCTTHHYACDCREAFYRQLHQEHRDLKIMLKAILLLLQRGNEPERIIPILRESLERHDTLNASDFYEH
jgi:hypothetical protein